jgi:ABC-2 type transport system permease protein
VRCAAVAPLRDRPTVAALLAEWTKVRTVRGTAWLPVLAVVLFVGLSAAVGAAAAPGTTMCSSGCDTARLGLTGVYSGQLGVVVLAVLMMTAEYETGLIAVTLTAVPRRLTVLLAKAVVLVTVVLPAALVSVVGSLVVSDINGFPEPARHAGVATVVHLVLVALLALGLAAAVRNTAPTLILLLALLYLAPLLARVVPSERWQVRIERYAPMTAGLAGSWRGSAILAGYAALALALGAVRLLRRDA